MESNNFKRITSADANSTVTVSGKGCILARITINKLSAHALTIRAGGTTEPVIGVLVASAPEGTYEFEVACAAGLQIDIPASYVGDATIAWR